MSKTTKNSTSQVVSSESVEQLEEYHFPHTGRTIKARSLEEAVALSQE